MTHRQYSARFGWPLRCRAPRSHRKHQCRRCAPIRSRSVALYQELVETNTTLSGGQLHAVGAANRGAPQGGGICRQGSLALSVPDHPKEGGLAAVLAGSSSTAKADVIAGPSGCGRSQARGLDSRSLHIDRGKWLFLRPRRGRHESDRRDLDSICSCASRQAAITPSARSSWH